MKVTSTNPVYKCPICSNPMGEKKHRFSDNYYYQCYKCKITIELFKALVELA